MKNGDTRDKEELLKLLYNLKSEDSCILKRIELDKKELEDKKESVEQQKLQANETYLSLKKDEECALLGVEYAEDFFNVYEENEVLRHYFKLLNVDFDPQAAKDAVNAEKKQKTLQKSLIAKIDEEANLIEKLGNENNDLEIKISEAGEQISDYEHTRAGVESLVNDVLSGNNSYNREYVENILTKISSFNPSLGFTKDEIINVGIMILFPEQGLSDFAERYEKGEVDIKIEVEEPKEEAHVEEETPTSTEPEDIFIQNITNSNNFVEEKEEVKEETDNEPIIVEETDDKGIFSESPETVELKTEEIPIVIEADEEVPAEPVVVEDEPTEVTVVEEETPAEEDHSKVESVYSSENPVDSIIPIIETPAEEETPVVEETTEVGDEEIEKKLSELNIDLYNFEDKELALKVLRNADFELIKKNYEELAALGATDRSKYLITKEEYSHLTDPELSQKINFLRSKLLKDETIVKLIDGNLFADTILEDLKNRAELIEQNGDKVGESNYILLKYNPKRLDASIEVLAELDMEPDEKEELYYAPVLAKNYKYVPSDTEVLKDYGISIYRRNGKHEYGIYWKKPLELINSIDDIVEIGEEDLLDTTPEALALNADYVIQKINYCKENEIPYFDESDGKTYQGFIYKVGTFAAEFENPELKDLIHREETNRYIKESGSRKPNVEMLVEALKNYYYNLDEYQTIKLEDTNEIDTFEKIKNTLEEEFKAELVSKNTYRIDEEYISRNKFERNVNYLLKELANSNQDANSMINEIIYVSLLFNSRKKEDVVSKIAKRVLG